VYSVKNVLELNEIQSQVKNEYTHTIGGGLGLANTLAELWLLHDEDYDRAKAVIETQILHPPPLSPWICDKCGEMNEGSFQVCWKCQQEP
jgi:hypothetical protein